MVLIIILDLIVIAALTSAALRKGYDEALPLAACLLLIFPTETRIQLPGLFDLTTQRIIVLALCVLYLAVGRREALPEVRRSLPLRYPLAILIVWMLLSSARSVVPAISFKSTLSQYFDFCTIYLIYEKRVRSRELMEKVMGGFVVGMAICSLIGLIEIYLDWRVESLFPAVAGRFSDLTSVDSRGSRVTSTFDHAILFGAALSLAIPMALYLISVVKSRMHSLLLWTALFAMMLCIYKTNSRGPWLALSLSLFLILLFGTGKLRKILTIMTIVAVLVLVARPGMRDSISSLYGATLDPESPQGESYQWRYVLYHIATRELSKDFGRSLWGYGPESFYYLGLTTDFMIEGEMHTVKVESCDSAVVELMMDTGYVGFFLVVVLLGTGVVVGVRRYMASTEGNESAYLVLVANILAFCFLMTNVELFGWGQQSYMLWIVLALTMAPVAQLAQGESHTSVQMDEREAWYSHSARVARAKPGAMFEAHSQWMDDAPRRRP